MPKYILGEVSTEVKESFKGDKTGIPIVGLEHLTPEEVTLSSWDKDIENTFTKTFAQGDMLFGRRRAYLKKAAIAPFEGICSGDITVLRAKADILSPNLMPFLIQSDDLFDFAVGKSAGSLSPRVKWEHLKTYELILPSLEEQEKTAEVLWAIEDTCQGYKKLLAETDELVQSQFIEMFGNTINGEFKYKKGLLEDLCYYESSNIQINKLENNTGEYPLFGASGLVKNVDFYNSKLPYVAIVKDGAGVGRVFKCDEYSSVVGTLGRIYPKENCSLRYLELLLRFLDLGKSSTGATIPHIYYKDYSKIEVCLPPADKQDEYSMFVEQSDKSKFALQQSLEEARALQKKIVEENFILGKER